MSRLVLIALLTAIVAAEIRLAGDLTEVSLEEPANVQITSISRKEQRLSKTVAVIFAITREHIGRSGTAIIPDLFRLAPGADVAQVDANTYEVSVRGFNDRPANKILVLIDGGTVDARLEDIDPNAYELRRALVERSMIAKLTWRHEAVGDVLGLRKAIRR